MDPAKERVVARQAEAQLGLITSHQLETAGMSRSTVHRRALAGLLVPCGSRTYRLAGTPLTPHTELLAACLDLGAVASHRSAAWLHGLWPHPRPVEVTVVRGRSVPPRALTRGELRVHASTNLPPDDILTVDAVPTTSVARTLLGLAALDPAEVDDEALTSTVEDAVRRRLASDRWLWWLLEQRRCRGRNGVIRFEAVLADRARLGPTESWLEREVLTILEDARLPLPVVQRSIRRRGAFVARVDFLYPEPAIVLEALGYTWHRSRSATSDDAARASRLALLGFEVHQFTYDQIVRDPSWVISVVDQALAQAAA